MQYYNHGQRKHQAIHIVCGLDQEIKETEIVTFPVKNHHKKRFSKF